MDNNTKCFEKKTKVCFTGKTSKYVPIKEKKEHRCEGRVGECYFLVNLYIFLFLFPVQ